LLLALVSFAAMPYGVLLPVLAADVLGGGPHALGLLSAASGLGALSGALVVLGGLVCATRLPRLRRHARPVYARLGILPEAAAGVNAATEFAPGSRA
jgi:hypothetical protein